ncbi:hypothetical protein [Candidatus Methanoperedens nitratireducens]|uniref:hypothetical protein n=1 Tax=Candidatus Methanoperedens nitratireducens TaxID=1392998 RepID=UPI000BB85A33|nr:hypothetical protein [Candidatus Methanoperedens nitroreducens]
MKRMAAPLAAVLLVVFIEFANPSGQVCQKPAHLLLLLLLASISGILWVEVTHFLFRRMQFDFPPAAAISLLPTIIPKEMNEKDAAIRHKLPVVRHKKNLKCNYLVTL